MGGKLADGAMKSPKISRDDRLKAALKANMARRKAQARARSDDAQYDDAALPGQQTPDNDKDGAV
jgi:hypothetical protein